jgi:hypothetical protein
MAHGDCYYNPVLLPPKWKKLIFILTLLTAYWKEYVNKDWKMMNTFRSMSQTSLNEHFGFLGTYRLFLIEKKQTIKPSIQYHTKAERYA